MEETLLKLIAQTPGIGACLFLVVYFLRHVEKRSKASAEMLHVMHTDHLKAREETREVIIQNTGVQRENCLAAAANTAAIIRLTDAIHSSKLRP